MEETKAEGNKILSQEKRKLSYKKDLWMYFDSIKEKFYFERNKAKTLLYIISQKNDIDYEYSENLKYLFNQYINQYNINQEKLNSNGNNNTDKEKNTLNKAIKYFIYSLKTESDLYFNHTKEVLNNIIRPLECFIMTQIEKANEFPALMKSYEKEFMNAFKQLEQKQINFFQGGRSVETAMNKLEIFKNKIKNNSNKENDINENDNEKEENDKEMIEKMEEILEKNKQSAKQLQLDYQEYIIKANAERDKYIKFSEQLYDKSQNLDEEFIKQIKTDLISLTQKNINLIENIKKNHLNTLQILQEINIEKEIDIFINSKLTKFSQPKKFEYLDYTPYLILRNRQGHIDAFVSEISSKIIECLKETFKCEKSKDNLIEEENINFVNETVNDIWNGNDFNKNRLEILFKQHIYRMTFLKMLNQYRVEGIFILEKSSFKNFCISFSLILDKSILDDDYESIKLCMILSQTFYLQAEKKILLQSSLTLNIIWQDKIFWERMIEYSINDEINNSKEYSMFLNEDGKMRQKRVESAIMSNLITFLFNMKLFGYPEDKSKIVIDEFIQKYNCDGNLIYSTNISMKEIKEDIFEESINNIINNEIKEYNEININSKNIIEDNNIKNNKNNLDENKNNLNNGDINNNDKNDNNKVKEENDINSKENKDNDSNI